MKAKIYGKLHRDKEGKRWVISDVAPHVALKLKQLFPKIPTYVTKQYTLPLRDDISADLVWFMGRYPLSINDADLRALRKMNGTYLKEQAAAEAILSPDYIPRERVGIKEGQILRAYQKVAVDLAEQVRRMLLIDEMGLGKTYEGLAMATIPGNLPMVIVMEPHLQTQWAAKAESYIDLKVHCLKGNTPYSLPVADIYLVKYNQLAPWIEVLTQGWVKALIFDEVQNLRTGEDSSKGCAAKALCAHVDFVVGMTGTLVYNYGIECWNIADIISPGILGTRDEFLREWCTLESGDRGVVKDPDALGSYLREVQLMLRRTREEVGQEAKQTKPEIITVSPDDQQIKSMEALAEQLAMRVIDARGWDERRDTAGEFDKRLRQMTGIAKARPTAAFVRMLVESGSPVVLFGFHHEVYNIWMKELADLEPAWYTGRETPAQKAKEYERFMSGKTNLIIISLLSGAGLDGLQHRCRNVVFGEFDWSPSRHEQGIRRVDRDGQDWMVYVYYMMSNFGSDPSMMDVLGVKEDQCRGIQDPGMTPAIKQIQTNRIQEMALRFLKSKGHQMLPTAESLSLPNEELAACL